MSGPGPDGPAYTLAPRWPTRRPTIESVREQFTALRNPLAFFDGPAGTQVPDSVIERDLGVPAGGEREPRRRVRDLEDERRRRRRRARRGFGAPRRLRRRGDLRRQHDDAQLRALAHGRHAGGAPATRSSRRSSTTTRTSRLARARARQGHHRPLLRLRRRGPPRPRPAALARLRPHARGRVPVGLERARHRRRPSTEIVAIAHEAGALAWCDAVHYAPHGPIDLAEGRVDVLLCSPYKFYGPHLGVAAGRRELLQSWRPYKVRPRRDSRRPPLRDGHARARAALRLRRRRRVRADEELEVHQRARADARAALPRRPARRVDAARPADDGRPRLDLRDHARRGVAGEAAAERLAEARLRGLARQLLRARGDEAPRPADGAIRVGIVHYNTEDEVDGLLAELGS